MSLLGARLPTAVPDGQASRWTYTRAEAPKKDPKGVNALHSLYQKTPLKIQKGEEAVIIGPGSSSRSEESSAASDNSSPSSGTSGNMPPSIGAVEKLPPGSSQRSQARAQYSLEMGSAFVGKQTGSSAPQSVTLAQRASQGQLQSVGLTDKSSAVPKEPKGRSTISFKLEKSGSKQSASSKKSSSHYTTTQSTGESLRSATAQSPSDVAETVVRTGEQSVPRNLEQGIRREKFLYPAAVCLAFVLALVLCFLFWPKQEPSAKLRSQIDNIRFGATCASDACLRRASYLSNLLSWRDVEPCDDFNAFVCSHWRSRFASAAKYHSTSTDDDNAEFLEEKVHAFLQDGRRSPKIAQPLKFLHDECMNLRRIDYEGVQALKDLMTWFSLEGFPLRAPLATNVSVWRTAAQLLRKTGTVALLTLSVASHPAVENKDLVSVGLPEVLTSFDPVESSDVIRLYTEAVFTAIKIVKKEYMPPGDILAIATFASNIEKLVQAAPRENTAKVERLESRSELQDFVNTTLQGFEGSVADGAMSDVLIWSPNSTLSILELVANTKPHTVMNYLGLRLMVQVSPFTPYSKLLDLLSILIYGKTRMAPPRWRLCVRVVERALRPLAFASVFAHGKLRKSAPNLIGMVDAVVVELRNEMNELPYIAYPSKKQIREILSRSDVRVFGPSWATDSAPLTAYVKKLPDVTNSRWGLDTFVTYHEHTFFHVLTRGSRERWSRSVFSADCWHETHPRSVYVPLLAFNLSQALEEGGADALQLSRLGPRLSRCLFDMLLDEAVSANVTASWLNDNTWMKLLAVEACLDGRRDYLRLARFRDVLAVRVAFKVFLKTTGGKDDDFAVRLPGGHIMSSAQIFFAYLMLQYCERSDGVYQMRSAANADWGAALRNSDAFSGVYNCSPSSVTKQSLECAA
ncbi:hypothetical protein HPB49_015278 [Dermacentor silvarum]|uniref:Uncharacterized protein n=1 Tax=Dermacentor silvarum TaxID=543639 RepID=A0ACB8DDZ3_DERSI|nr:hypothetical protein HPB49_015278 [Dermacentor silvarum]